MAYIPINVVTIITLCAAAWQIFLTQSDPARYQCYALTFWLGGRATSLLPAAQCAFLHAASVSMQPPFHMLPLEYPPLTLLPFSLALLAPVAYYQLAFALLMAFTSVLIYWVLLRYGPRGAALSFTLYIFVGGVATAQNRFDLIPAVLTLLCIVAAERKHWTAAYVALAFGVLFKIYPILLLPSLFIAEQQTNGRFFLPPPSFRLKSVPYYLWKTLQSIQQWKWKNSLLFFALVAGVTAFFATLNFQEATVSQLNYFIQRPIQVESLGSTLLWILSDFKVPHQIVYSFGSVNIMSTLSHMISLASSGLFILGCLYLIYLQWRRKLDLTQVSIALLLVFIATGKVFSPQYTMWLMPLLAYAGAFDTFWLLLWGTVSLITSVIFAYLYTRPVNPLLIPLTPGFFQLVGTRNVFFLVITLAYLFNWHAVRKREPLPSLPTHKPTEPLLLAEPRTQQKAKRHLV